MKIDSDFIIVILYSNYLWMISKRLLWMSSVIMEIDSDTVSSDL